MSASIESFRQRLDVLVAAEKALERELDAIDWNGIEEVERLRELTTHAKELKSSLEDLTRRVESMTGKWSDMAGEVEDVSFNLSSIVEQLMEANGSDD